MKLTSQILKQAKLADVGSDSAENLKAINKLNRQLRGLYKSPLWVGAKNDFTGAISDIAELTNEYVKGIFDLVPPKELAEHIQNEAIRTVTDGYNAAENETTASIKRVLKQNIGKGGNLAQMRLEALITGADGVGVLQSKASQITHDSIFQFNREYLYLVTADIEVTHYIYAGSAIKTTRDFCRTRHDKIHTAEEVASWAKLDWDGKNPKTNASNFYLYMGGYGCRHKLVPYQPDGFLKNLPKKAEKQKPVMLSEEDTKDINKVADALGLKIWKGDGSYERLYLSGKIPDYNPKFGKPFLEMHTIKSSKKSVLAVKYGGLEVAQKRNILKYNEDEFYSQQDEIKEILRNVGFKDVNIITLQGGLAEY